ncbi:GNAT family N-acetyltransferase [Oceanobacillus neutriphilus]|uniref:Protein RibT n=1 Tax=Oceanobacillus neutriphilus TaxID=531815 RepID=A0ABQ2NTV3_9BACI|nr:GNAT family N-acetyltransferase [Oceanobacillus neutriphilus]GGP10395.1 protein RibT [Oceanobacillus neutriphilus]
MLIRFKRNLEKIAMGLLSFMPEEKDVKKLQETIREYEENDGWHLHLWKEDDDVLGAIGVQITNDNQLVIKHLTVNPSHRDQGIGSRMIAEIHRIYSDKYDIVPAESVKAFYEKSLDGL